MKFILPIYCLIALAIFRVHGQEDTTATHDPTTSELFIAPPCLDLESYKASLSSGCRNRKIAMLSAYTGIYAGGMTALYNLWYKNYSGSGFHLFNDNNEWLQMDKAGHVYSAYHLGEFGYVSAKYACFSENQSLWLGSSYGLLFLTTIEIFDGFSAGWGASAGDIIANTSGYLFFTGQQHFWNEQKFRLKFTYSPGKYAQYRPDLLGETHLTRIFKDYNAQTYWISFSPSSFTSKTSNRWPEWLCISLGYSAEGMIGGTENPAYIDGKPAPEFIRQRQYYFSFDIDFSKIHTNSKLARMGLFGLNMLKVPFPAISYDRSNNFMLLPVGF